MRPFVKMNKENTALLVIDVINSCANEKCEIPEWDIHFSKIREMVPRLEKFIEEYRQRIGGLMIFGRTMPWQKEYLAHNVNELYEDERFSYYTRDRSGFAEEFYKVKPQNGDIVTDKNTNDALTNPELADELERRGIRYLLIVGVFTDGCVLATVIGGFSRGYNLIVLKDLVETTDSKTRQEIQKHLLEFTFPYMFARVTDSQQMLNDWE